MAARRDRMKVWLVSVMVVLLGAGVPVPTVDPDVWRPG
jgi:hypothetical protein